MDVLPKVTHGKQQLLRPEIVFSMDIVKKMIWKVVMEACKLLTKRKGRAAAKKRVVPVIAFNSLLKVLSLDLTPF